MLAKKIQLNPIQMQKKLCYHLSMSGLVNRVKN